jgi:tRNA nucleotidyltransferase/poly(A) polymerase
VLDEDPLRLLRAVRFASTLGFTIEEATKNHIKSRAALVTKPSPERIRDEFFQILSQRGAGEHLTLMDSLGLLSRTLPELDSSRGFLGAHIYDVVPIRSRRWHVDSMPAICRR